MDDKRTPTPIGADRVGADDKQEHSKHIAVEYTGQALRDGIADEIRRAYEAGGEHAKKAVLWWVRVGDLLCEAKRSVPHGEWAPWVDENAPFGGRMARKYMQLSENAPAILAKLANRNSNSVLTIDGALALAAEPKPVPRPAGDAELARQINGRIDLAIEAARRELEHAKIAGENLLNAKGALTDDEWLPWLKANTECSAQQAERYMAVATNWEQIQSETGSDALVALINVFVDSDASAQR
jgi:hypothetical protein